MGCYNTSCAITNLPIKENDDVMAILMVQAQNPSGSMQVWYPTPIIVWAKYDGYGGVKEIVAPCDKMLGYFKDYLTEYANAAYSENSVSRQLEDVLNTKLTLKTNNTIEYLTGMAFITRSTLEPLLLNFKYSNKEYSEICDEFFAEIRDGKFVDSGFGARHNEHSIIGNMSFDFKRVFIPSLINVFDFYSPYICVYKNQEDLKYYTFGERDQDLVDDVVVNMTSVWMVTKYLSQLNRQWGISTSSGQVFVSSPFDFLMKLMNDRINELKDED